MNRYDTDAIWESIIGAAPLKQAYGYWPTLHDAQLRQIAFRFADRMITMTFDYSDAIGEAGIGPDINTRLTMQWKGVVSSELRLHEGSVYGVQFSRIGETVETRFEDGVWALDGTIVAASVEVVKIESAPDMSDLPDTHPAHHEVRIYAE